MNGADLLRLRAAEELRGLDRVWDLLSSRLAGVNEPRKANLVSTYQHHRRALTKLNNGTEPRTWDELSRVVKGVGAFEREAFCYALGRFVRAGTAGRLEAWPAADRLLRWLADRTGIAEPPLTGLEFEVEWERLEPLLELVRLRYPGTGFWDLPVMAHEFGHYVLTQPPAFDPVPFQQLCGDVAAITAELRTTPAPWQSRFAETASQSEQRVNELVADIFATYAVGPAYPRCCVALRIPPDDTDALRPQHPPWRHRVSAMVETLRWMSEHSADGGYLNVVAEDVARLWSDVARGSDAGAGEQVREWVAQVAGSLDRFSGLRYDKGYRADRILAADPDVGDDVLDGCTVAHVLNAGWTWRLRNDDQTLAEVTRAELAFLGYCDRVE